MSLLRYSSFLVVVGALTACGSSTSTPPPSSGTSGGTSGDPSGASACTVTFGGDAASVKVMSCHQLGPLVMDSTVLSFTGDATGLVAPVYALSMKFKNPLAVKTYQTADLFYVSNDFAVTSTGKTYAVDFDSSNATTTRDGSVTATFTTAEHGTIDMVLDSSDKPAAHATVHITF
jgi:hypothetical protein